MHAEAIDPTAKRDDTKYRFRIGAGYLLNSEGQPAELTVAEVNEAYNKRFPDGCYVMSEGTVTDSAAVKTKKVKV